MVKTYYSSFYWESLPALRARNPGGPRSPLWQATLQSPIVLITTNNVMSIMLLSSPKLKLPPQKKKKNPVAGSSTQMHYWEYLGACTGFKWGFSSVIAGLFPFTKARMGVCGLLRSPRHVARFPPSHWPKARVWEDGGKTSLGGLVLKIRTKLQSESIRASV